MDWSRVRSLFDQALDLPTAQRQSFLAQRETADSVTRCAVLRMLAAHEHQGGPLSEPLWLAEARESPTAVAERAGDDGSYYPYRPLRVIGRGGMGSVLLAERSDARFEKQVAIKRLDPLLDRPALRRRFTAERQALARLEHPNICRLLDAGETPDGTPYVVMEYVDGQDIRSHCDAHCLGISARLDLIRSVCAAVHHAHENRIVHSDLKPSNIMIERAGNVRLVDFGLAKLLERSDGGENTTQTGLALTPDYASPEQWNGEGVSVASDVYSLGIVLYELLTGERPCRWAGRSLAEVRRLLTFSELPLPSVAWRRRVKEAVAAEPRRRLEALAAARQETPSSLGRRLAGDLDSIVRRATHRDPVQRYGSMALLAEDLRRWQDGLPVAARQAGATYRFFKLVARHRLVSVLATLTILLAGLALTAVSRDARRNAASQSQALQGRQRVAALAEMVMDSVDYADPLAVSSTAASHDFLTKACPRLLEEFDEPSDWQARLLNKVGSTLRHLGAYDAAVECHRHAVGISRALAEPGRLELVSSLAHLSTALRLRGDFKAAEPIARDALEMRIEIFGEDAAAVAESLENLAEILHELGRFAEAGPLYRRALEVRRQVAEASGQGREELLSLAASLDYYGLFLKNVSDLPGALAAYEEAAELRRPLLPANHLLQARSGYHRGAIHLEMLSYEEARRFFLAALPIYRQALGERHPEVAKCLNDLGVVSDRLGRLDDAASYHRQALELRRQVLGGDHIDVAQSLLNSGRLAIRQGRLDRAESLLGECLDICRRKLSHHPYAGVAWLARSEIAAAKGDPAAAVRQAREGIRILKHAFGRTHWRVAEAEGTLATYYLALGRRPQALAALGRARASLVGCATTRQVEAAGARITQLENRLTADAGR